jgi:hypothetical protein
MGAVNVYLDSTGRTEPVRDQTRWLTTAVTVLCPDGLRYEQIGAADTGRGRVVRAFFWLLQAWPGPKT